MIDDSDYIVEHYIKPVKVRVPLINDERADILGNFEDAEENTTSKRKKDAIKVITSEENPFSDQDDEDQSDMEPEGEVGDDVDEIENKVENEDDTTEIDLNGADETSDTAKEAETLKKKKSKKQKPEKIAANLVKHEPASITEDQVKTLMRGISKKDHFVLYVTNLNYETTKPNLEEFFGNAGAVKSIRIPKTRRSAFAFVEMCDLNGYKNALGLHNQKLDGRPIKIQVSEGGKKKSANKKNILKQKNRKLAEMRNEPKQFNRSGKGYDKTIKKEIHQRKMQMNRRLAKKQNKKN